MFYRVDFRCDDRDPLQRQLDDLYGYRDDRETRVLHRLRLNLFFLLLGELVEARVVTGFGSALDIGCNAGAYSRILSDYGFRSVTGIDIDETQIGRAKAAFASPATDRSIEFRVANAEELDRTRQYDFVLCTEVIEHTRRPQRVVANLAAAVAPGGIAVVTMPNAFSLPYVIARTAHRLRGKPHDPVLADHLKYPFWRALRLFEGHGLDVVRTTGTNLLFNARLLAWLARNPLLPPLSRVQFALARRWPFKYAAMFFFMVLKRER